MHPLKLTLRIFIVIILTALTQIGGVVYLISTLSYKNINKNIPNLWRRAAFKLVAFLMHYIVAAFFVVPFIAIPFGRVPLPHSTLNHLRPHTLLTCILNRNYVRPELRDAAYNVATQMEKQYPDITVNYLDANFPFFNHFGLLPHLSHNDGKKLDLSFCYNNNQTGAPTNNAPSFIGYGICEEPKQGEVNTAEDCGRKGYWQYNALRAIVPQGNKANYTFNEERTKHLVELFAADPAIGKIFIEPHLRTRLHLSSDKIRFQGCHAVRHDDHIHVQLK